MPQGGVLSHNGTLGFIEAHSSTHIQLRDLPSIPIRIPPLAAAPSALMIFHPDSIAEVPKFQRWDHNDSIDEDDQHFVSETMETIF